jgi:hypothetical protein
MLLAVVLLLLSARCHHIVSIVDYRYWSIFIGQFWGCSGDTFSRTDTYWSLVLVKVTGESWGNGSVLIYFEEWAIAIVRGCWSCHFFFVIKQLYTRLLLKVELLFKIVRKNRFNHDLGEIAWLLWFQLISLVVDLIEFLAHQRLNPCQVLS